MKAKLTLRAIEAALAAAQPYEIRDTDINGLLLRVQPSGVKSYVVEWAPGKRRTLGRYPVMTLDGARTEALGILADAAKNGTPSGGNSKTRIETFGDFMTLRYGPHVEATAKTGAATHANIKAQFEHLYSKRLAAITRADFDKFKADRLKAGLHPSTVNRDLDPIKAALTTAVLWKIIPINPLLNTKRIKRGIEERVRYLSPDEEASLRKALSARDTLFQAKRQSANTWRSERGRAKMPPILAYCDHVSPMARVGINTGLRRGELTQLT